MPAAHIPIRIALYTRAATGSPDNQEAQLRSAVAAMPLPHVVAGTFRDPTASGVTLSRPGLRDLLAATRARAIDVVVVNGLGRLSRSPRDLAHLRSALAAQSVRITTPDGEREPALAALTDQVSTLHP